MTERLDPDIRAYYERGQEAGRLLGGFSSGPLEFARTKEILERFLPAKPVDVLDVGGGPGLYAAWLAGLGHRVTLIEPVPLHVEQAREAHPAITAHEGDACSLAFDHESFDVVLMLGPLYHLVDRTDRIKSLREARRVLRPPGILVAAAISRYAALLDLLIRADRLHEEGVLEIVKASIETGVFNGTHNNLFTTAYFHLPAELAQEIIESGFENPEILAVEGPGCLVPNFAAGWEDPQRREALLESSRLIESKPELAAMTGHFLAIARPMAGTIDST